MHKVLLIGDGRVAKHLSFYLRQSGFSCSQWSRKTAEQLPSLKQMFDRCDRALLVVSDAAIPSLLRGFPFLKSEKVMHCSGSLALREIESAHPLMTFGPELYSLDVYKKIPFITEAHRRPFSELLPGLENPAYTIAAEKKALYHALCSISGNFSTLLWEQAMQQFEESLRLPRHVLLPYMERIFENLKYGSESVLTGPLVRGDVKTIVQHLDSLAGQPEQNLYYAFVDYYLRKNNKLGELQYEHIRI